MGEDELSMVETLFLKLGRGRSNEKLNSCVPSEHLHSVCSKRQKRRCKKKSVFSNYLDDNDRKSTFITLQTVAGQVKSNFRISNGLEKLEK